MSDGRALLVTNEGDVLERELPAGWSGQALRVALGVITPGRYFEFLRFTAERRTALFIERDYVGPVGGWRETREGR